MHVYCVHMKNIGMLVNKVMYKEGGGGKLGKTQIMKKK